MLLCRPRGGLNDMLSQIERCCRYAEMTDRSVIVDTKFGRESFGDDFDRYFISRQSRLVLSASELRADLDRAEVFPTGLKGRVSSYDWYRDETSKLHVDRQTGEPLTFDFAQDYPHDLLVHQQPRRRPYAVSAFMRLRLQPQLTHELLARFAKIGGPYLGVHIRHTDYQSDYQPVIEQVAAAKLKKLFLATDNQQILDLFRTSLPGKEIHSFARDLSVDGNPIHLRSADKGDVFRRNNDAILDLLLLALSGHIVSADITNSPYGFKKSGFTVLAMELASQKRYLSELLGEGVKIGLD
jgi:hypothetical protein